MKKLIVVAFVIAGISLVWMLHPTHVEAQSAKGKYLIILQAGTESHEGLARALHALLYTRELIESGHEAALIFDGAGTEWARDLAQPDHRLHGQYAALENLGVTQEICDYCSGAFQVKESLTDEQRGLLNDAYSGHPSIVKWVSQGYQVIVL